MGTLREIVSDLVKEMVFGMDSSAWDDIKETPAKPNFMQAFSRGAKFNYVRTTFGLTKDREYDSAWKANRLTGMLLGNYHFLVWEQSPEEQARFFWDIIKDDPGELPIVVDFEWWSTNPTWAIEWLYRFIEELRKFTDHAIAIYTAQSYWIEHVVNHPVWGKKLDYWKQFYLWLAHYNTTPPTEAETPRPWTLPFMWQYTGHGDGKYYGMESEDLDLDYFMGTWPELLELCDIGENKMGWNDNPLGVVVSGDMNVDFAKLKAEGASFVIVEVGVGFTPNPAFAEQYTKVNAAGLPLVLQYSPYPAFVDYTTPGLVSEQLNLLRKWISGRKFSALIISADRYWVGDNEASKATQVNVNDTMKGICESIYNELALRDIKLLLRTNDNFVKNYAPGISTWADKFHFDLVDWRYRTKDSTGAYTVYNYTRSGAVASLNDVRAFLPEDCKNPLVPGSAPTLKFWGFTRIQLPYIVGWDNSTKSVETVLFNGDVTALASYFPTTVTPPPPPVDPPVDNSELATRVTNLETKMEAITTKLTNLINALHNT